MASAASIKAGEAFVRIYAKDREAQDALKRMGERMDRFAAHVAKVGATLSAAGAGLMAPFAASAKTFASYGDQLDKMSGRTGLAVEELSKIGFAAGQSGTDIKTFESALRSMQATLGNAEAGMTKAQQSLARIGVTMDDLRGLSALEQFDLIAAGVSRIDPPTMRAAAAMKILGESGAQLVPMMGSLSELRAEAESLGLVVSGSQAKAAAELVDAYGRMTATAKAAAVAVGGALAPSLTAAGNTVAAMTAAFNQFAEANPTLVKVAAGAALLTVALGGSALAVAGIVKAGAVATQGYRGFAKAVTTARDALTGKTAADKAAAAALTAATEAGNRAVAAQEALNKQNAEATVAATQVADAESHVHSARDKLARATHELATAEALHMEATLGAKTNTELAASAERAHAEATRAVKSAQTELQDAEAQATAAREQHTQATWRATEANNAYGTAMLKAGYAAKESAQATATATGIQNTLGGAVRGSGAAVANAGKQWFGASGKLGGLAGKAAGASLAVTMLSGSISAMAGDSAVGDVAGKVAGIAGTIGSLAMAVPLLAKAGPALAAVGAGIKGAGVAVAGAAAAIGAVPIIIGAAAAATVAAGVGIAYYNGETKKAERNNQALDAVLKVLNRTRGQGLEHTVKMLRIERDRVLAEIAGGKHAGSRLADLRAQVAALDEQAKKLDAILVKQRAAAEAERARNRQAAKEAGDAAQDAGAKFDHDAKEQSREEDKARRSEDFEALVGKDAAGAARAMKDKVREIGERRHAVRKERELLQRELNELERATADTGGTEEQRTRMAQIGRRLYGAKDDDEAKAFEAELTQLKRDVARNGGTADQRARIEELGTILKKGLAGSYLELSGELETARDQWKRAEEEIKRTAERVKQIRATMADDRENDARRGRREKFGEAAQVDAGAAVATATARVMGARHDLEQAEAALEQAAERAANHSGQEAVTALEQAEANYRRARAELDDARTDESTANAAEREIENLRVRLEGQKAAEKKIVDDRDFRDRLERDPAGAARWANREKVAAETGYAEKLAEMERRLRGGDLRGAREMQGEIDVARQRAQESRQRAAATESGGPASQSVGSFSARAMRAMVGGGGNTVAEKQLAAQQIANAKMDTANEYLEEIKKASTSPGPRIRIVK